MTTIDYYGIRTLLLSHGINPVKFVVGDQEYNLPAKSWILNDFSKSLKSLLKFLGVDDYELENNDCEDFARSAAGLGQILHHRTSPKAKTGLAIGEFWYRDEKLGTHAINIIIYLDVTPKLMFFEPQNQTELFLSEEEVQSCSFWRF